MHDSPSRARDQSPPAYEILAPDRQSVPYVYASPHSGDYYPPEFIAGTAHDALGLRRSEDSFVDRLFGGAPRHGAPLLRALYPRVFVDPNREPFELDPAMFEDKLPDFVNTNSARVAVGLGTVPWIVASGAPIYDRKLTFAEARTRIDQVYVPYHSALRRLVETTVERFGGAVVIDCHSMPSATAKEERDSGQQRADIILGDRFGASCHAAIVEVAEDILGGLGYRVTRNDPYAGGFVARHYGRPGHGIHCLQIEINRALYMDEARIRPHAGMKTLTAHLDTLMAVLGRIDPARIVRATGIADAAQ